MRCCICGKEFEGYGNNPWPFCDDEDARCCDDCNRDTIIPARLAIMLHNEKKAKEALNEYSN